MRFSTTLPAAALLICFSVSANAYDYYAKTREVIRNGQQAVLTCNGLFTSQRTLEQVKRDELAYMSIRREGLPLESNVSIDATARAVTVGGGADGDPVTAAYRAGIGCVVMAPGMGLEDIDALPELAEVSDPKVLDPRPWPMGDADAAGPAAPHFDAEALSWVGDWAFDRPTPEQKTISLLVVHKGKIVLERYADGFDWSTRTRTWSTAKSIASALIGMRAEETDLSLDAPLNIEWLPETPGDAPDPRDSITLRHALNMATGLQSVDNAGMHGATGSGLSYWGGASSVDGARSRALIREPGTRFDYENYDTLLAVKAFKNTFEDEGDYHRYPRERLLDKIGMRTALLSTDRFGDFILSSQTYINARDLARFGMLYAQGGRWQGEQVIPEAWIEFTTKPVFPDAVIHEGQREGSTGRNYGGHWWLPTQEYKDRIPADAFTTNGNRGQYVIVVPSEELVIVRRGLDYGRQGFSPWALTEQVVSALEK